MVRFNVWIFKSSLAERERERERDERKEGNKEMKKKWKEKVKKWSDLMFGFLSQV